MTNSLIALAVIGIALLLGSFLKRRTPQVSNPDALVLTRLQKAGSNLSKFHEVEFFMYFFTEAAANSVTAALHEQGFATSVSRASAGGGRSWLILATRTMLLELEDLVRLRALLTDVCTAKAGVYDGWGTQVVE